MARMKRRARQWHLKGSFALAVLFAVGLFVSGAFGDVSPLTFSTSGSTDTTAATSSGDTSTDATSSAATDTSPTTTTDSTTTTTTDTTTTSASTAFAPSISSDLSDYPPGGTVTLTGSNWLPGESVHIFANDSIGQTWSYSNDVTADATGHFTLQFQLSSSFVANYSVT